MPDSHLPKPEPVARPIIGPALVEPDKLRNAILWLARQYGWSGDGQSEFGRLAGCGDRTVRRWLAGERELSGEVLVLLVGMIADPGLHAALRDEYEPGPLPISESMDRMLFALRREPALLQLLRPGRRHANRSVNTKS